MRGKNRRITKSIHSHPSSLLGFYLMATANAACGLPLLRRPDTGAKNGDGRQLIFGVKQREDPSHKNNFQVF
jgi:hypothetical protein